jgi:WD40 repeat protein
VNVLGEPPTLLRISPDEKYAAFATAKTGDAVSILDLESGRIVGHLLAQERVSGLGFSADGKHIVTVEEKGWARLWEADYFKAASVFKIPAHTAADVVFVNESQPQVFVSAMDRILRRISLTDSQTLNFEKGHQDQVIALKAAPDGSRVVSGGKDKLAILWDGSTGQSLTICRAHRDPVSEVALNPVRNLVASYDPKAGIKVWQAQSGMVIRTFSTGESLANCLLFTPEGGEVVAGGRDMALRVWDVRGRSTMPELALARILPVRKQMISDREFKVMLDTAGKAIRKRAYATAYSLIRKALTMPGHERSDAALEMILLMKENGKRIGLHGAWNKKSISAAAGVMDVCISPSAINFFSAQSDHTIRMWSTKTGDCLKTFKGHTNLVACLALSFNGREAVSGGDDRAVRTWDITTGRSLLVLQGHTDSVSSVTYSENGKTVLSGSWDGTIRQWHLPEGTLVKTLRAHEDKINTVALISHQEIVFSGGFEGVVRMWDLSTGKLLREMKGHRDRITSLSVSSSGELVISGSMDGTVRIWDVKRGTTIGTLEADATGVRVVAFSPEQKFALTGGNDAVLRIWNLETSQCLREFQGHSREISGARFSSNGRFIVTSSVDGGVIIWEVDWEWVFPGQKTTGTIIAPKKE